ncbi:MAG: Secretion system C-terminal sorting domain, partial [Bacteroidota bacterium]
GMMDVPTGSAQYTGENTTALKVAKVSLRNHNQPFRAIASTNICSDTSAVVLLTVSDSCINFKSVKVTDTLVVRTTLLVNSVRKDNLIKVYPVPTKDQLTINTGDVTLVGGYTLKVLSTTGATVYSQVISAQTYTVDLKTWANTGFYTLQLIDKSGATIATKAIILE